LCSGMEPLARQITAATRTPETTTATTAGLMVRCPLRSNIGCSGAALDLSTKSVDLFGITAFRAAREADMVRRMAMTTTASGLSYEDTVPGTGPTPAKGQTCVMHYTGWLWVDGAKGSKFDSSVARGK